MWRSLPEWTTLRCAFVTAAVMSGTWQAEGAGERGAALALIACRVLSPGHFAALPPGVQMGVLARLILLVGRTEDAATASAAKDRLRSLPVSAGRQDCTILIVAGRSFAQGHPGAGSGIHPVRDLLLCGVQISAESLAALLLSAVAPSSAALTPSKKQRKAGGAGKGPASAPADWPPPGKRVLVGTVLLEMLLWKPDVTNRWDCRRLRLSPLPCCALLSSRPFPRLSEDGRLQL